jgi:hypothetical protein
VKDLLAAIEEQESLASSRGTLAEDRSDALDRYLGRPYGDEVEGRSSVVMRDVADTIEWILPSLLEVFVSGEEVARFDAVGPEDEEQSEQETDYVNHVVMQQNPGFLTFYDWFKDALLQKNGYVMAQPCKTTVAKKDRYEGLTDDEFALLGQTSGAEIIEHTAYPGPLGLMHHAVVRKTYEKGHCKTTNVPPERVLVASDWPNLHFKGCPFVEVIDFKTISDLREDGYDVEDTLSDVGTQQEDEWQQHRRSVTEESRDREDLGADAATRRVRVRYIWMKWDEDGDGIAELRKIVVVGKTILENEEDSLVPVACLTPIRQPHEHYGQSIDDLVGHLQRIHTVLMRGYLDNMYLANNGRNAINTDNVNLDDMLQARPGGVVRVKGNPAENIAPLVHPQVGSDILMAMEKIDQVRERSTGVNKNTQGLEADALDKTATEARQLMAAAQMKIKMIARIFAETGVRELMLIVHSVMMKSGRQQEIVKLRNKWVPVDPSTWSDRTNMTVTVGLGTGNKDTQSAFLMQVLGVQREALMAGLPITGPKQVYNTVKKLTQNAGFKNADEFWTDPESAPPQPPRPDPEQIKAQAALQLEQMKGQTTKEVEEMKARLKYETDLAAQQAQGMQESQSQEMQARLEQHKASLTAELEREKAQMQSQLEAMKLQAENERNIRDNETKLVIARISAQTAAHNAAVSAETSTNNAALAAKSKAKQGE